MSRILVCLFALSFLLTIAPGCSGDGAITFPSSNPTPQTCREWNLAGCSQTQLWGYYDILFEGKSHIIEILPNRSTMFSLNVVQFLNGSFPGVQFAFNGVTPGVGYVDVDVDISISHPLNLAEFDGYDVRGIFVGDGSGVMDYNEDLRYPTLGEDQIFLNADGYTRWFNPAEFHVPGIFGHTQGKLATPGYPATATLNPYKYFAEDLGDNDDVTAYLRAGGALTGYFRHGTSNTRDYLLRFPIPSPGVKYGYAVVANWSGVDPGDHPSHAPEALSCRIDNDSNVYYVNETQWGGSLMIDIGVFDWFSELTDGVMKDYKITVESTVTSAPYTLNLYEMDPWFVDGHYYVYAVEIPADDVKGLENNEVWIIVEYPGTDYSNPFGVPNSADGDPLTACFRFPLDVADYPVPWIRVLSPNGGEVWDAGSQQVISWESGNIPGDIRIEWSTDGFASTPTLIADHEPNEGVFVWDETACKFSDSFQVRIESEDDPQINDMSDSMFSIVDGGWAHTWGADGKDTAESVTKVDPSTGGFAVSGYSTVDAAEVRFKAFLRFYQPCGHLLWEREWSNAVDWGSVSAPAVTCGTGFSYVGGNFGGTVDFDPSIYGEIHTALGADGYLSKFDSSGSLVWMTTWGSSTGSSGVLDLAADDTGSAVYVSGVFSGTVDFDPSAGTYEMTAPGTWASFLSKFSSDGDFKWARKWGSAGDTWTYGLEVDVAGNLYAAGYFSQTVDFDPSGGIDQRTSSGSYDAFLTKFNSLGQHQWVRTWGETDEDYAYEVCRDTANNLYVAGCFQGSCDFDPGSSTDFHGSNGLADAFLTRFDANGNFLGAVTWGGSGWDEGQSVSADTPEDVSVTGQFRYQVDFDPDPAGEYIRDGGDYWDVFLSHFSNLDFVWARTWGSSNAESNCGQGVAVDSTGGTFAVGFVNGPADFAPSYPPCNDEPLPLQTGADAFLVRYPADGCW